MIVKQIKKINSPGPRNRGIFNYPQFVINSLYTNSIVHHDLRQVIYSLWPVLSHLQQNGDRHPALNLKEIHPLTVLSFTHAFFTMLHTLRNPEKIL